MKRIGFIGIFFLAFVSIKAQEDFNNKLNNPSTGKQINKLYYENGIMDHSLSKGLFMEINEPKFIFRNSIIVNNINYPLFNHKQNSISIIAYNESITHIGLGNVENIGGRLKWRFPKNISLDGGFFISRQYGYTLYSNHIGYGMNINLNYNLNTKLLFNLSGQYVMNQNKDPFMLHSPMLPHTGISVNLEYSPNSNTKFSLGAGIQESIYDRKKYEVNVEGKTSITF